MPTVPQAEKKETLRGLPGGGLPKPGGVAGAPLLDVTEAAVGVASREQEIISREKDRIDKTMVLDADYNLSLLKTNLEVERGKYKGKDAGIAFDDIKQRWEEGIQEIEKGLANDSQKLSFRNRVQHHWAGAGGLYESTLKYIDSEIGKFEDSTFKSVADLRIRNAVEIADQPELFEQSLEELKAITKDYYKHDPALGQKVFNDYVDEIKTGVKEFKLEKERKAKELAAEAKLEANNDLSDMLFHDTLTYEEIKKREADLGGDYGKWVKAYKADQSRKENELKKKDKPEDNQEINITLSYEAMTMPANTTAEDILAFKERVGEEVLKGNLTPKTARTIISDAERTFSVDPPRKALENDVITFFKNDYNDSVYGDVGTPEARSEYLKQLNAFRDWSRKNLDKDPIEYFERVSDTHTKNFVSRLFGLGKPEVTPAQRREEIASEDKREEAIKILTDKGYPTTDANINYVMGQL